MKRNNEQVHEDDKGGEKRPGHDDEELCGGARVYKGSFAVKRCEEFAPEVVTATPGLIGGRWDEVTRTIGWHSTLQIVTRTKQNALRFFSS